MKDEMQAQGAINVFKKRKDSFRMNRLMNLLILQKGFERQEHVQHVHRWLQHIEPAIVAAQNH